MARKPRKKKTKQIATLTHDEAKRSNIPTAELQPVMDEKDQSPIQVAYARRNRDLDPQLVWRGKDMQDWSDLVVPAPPLFIQEKVHPKVLIDDLMNRTRQAESQQSGFQTDLFADFNGLPDVQAKTEFYQHDANWTNRMILGDSLQVMASLAERENLRGKVQCIYFDPPYGIKFNSNFQWSTTSRDVKDGKTDHITREPEQVKAFRDTWRDGIHSYLAYIRDRLTVARELLTDSGSIFVQIGDENVHRVRAVMDEVFGEDNFCAQVAFSKATGLTSKLVANVYDHLLWYAKDATRTKYRQLFLARDFKKDIEAEFRLARIDCNSFQSVKDLQKARSPRHLEDHVFRTNSAISPGVRANTTGSFEFQGHRFHSGSNRNWKTTLDGMRRLAKSSRLVLGASPSRMYIQFWKDFNYTPITNIWNDVRSEQSRIYVVQTVEKVVQRCILMTSDPGDLVMDPTCGSGTTAATAEQWGRRWITIDTSRVALALARARLMGARYPFHLLSDSREGQIKEAEIGRTEPSMSPTYGDIRQGFVYERVPHITLKSIAHNAEIDVIWEQFQEVLEPLRSKLNSLLEKLWEEWEIPRHAEEAWSDEARQVHEVWWKERIARQQEIDASIAAKADYEYLYDKPYEDKNKVRVAGPFTVESLSPHRVLGFDENGDHIANEVRQHGANYVDVPDFGTVMLENLRTAGVQQAHKEDRIEFSSLTPWPGRYVCADGRYWEGGDGEDGDGVEKRAAIFIGPEFGTVSRADLVVAAREAGDAGFDVLIACAFSYEAHTTDFDQLGRIRVLKARMNADLHMAGDLKNTGQGNLFVIFGEPDFEVRKAGGEDAEDGQIEVQIKGVDVFHPQTGEVRSHSTDGIACWFIDTDYNSESFFVRHAYFLGANDPYKALKTTLKAQIDREAWESLNSDVSRPFDRPKSGRIAVKVINHLGDEVMKVFRVET